MEPGRRAGQRGNGASRTAKMQVEGLMHSVCMSSSRMARPPIYTLTTISMQRMRHEPRPSETVPKTCAAAPRDPAPHRRAAWARPGGAPCRRARSLSRGLALPLHAHRRTSSTVHLLHDACAREAAGMSAGPAGRGCAVRGEGRPAKSNPTPLPSRMRRPSAASGLGSLSPTRPLASHGFTPAQMTWRSDRRVRADAALQRGRGAVRRVLADYAVLSAAEDRPSAVRDSDSYGQAVSALLG
jgi:hypothetical protein